jgi:hypothetical protein
MGVDHVESRVGVWQILPVALVGVFRRTPGRMRGTRGHRGAQPAVPRWRQARGDLGPGKHVIRHTHMIAPPSHHPA